jgi:hypothetical protein
MTQFYLLEVGDGIDNPLPAYLGNKERAVELARKWVEMLGREYREETMREYLHWFALSYPANFALAVVFLVEVDNTDNFDELFEDKKRFLNHLKERAQNR